MITEGAPRGSRLFVYLAMATAFLTIGMIVFGAVVRVTDSGLGCGSDWPLCNGTVFPPLDNLTAWIEWLHRLYAALIGLFGIGMLAVAVAAYRRRKRIVLGLTVLAALLYTTVAGLGAFVVVMELPPTMVTLHLGVAMLLLGTFLFAAMAALYEPKQQAQPDNVSVLAYLTTGLTLVIILSGALVRGSGATLACTDWPLCNGALYPAGQNQLALVHMMHRYAVLGLGVALVLLVWFVFKNRTETTARVLAALGLTAYLIQGLVGAMFVVTAAAPIWGASHVGLAAITWAFLVSLSAMEVLRGRETQNIQEEQWQPQPEPALN